MKTKTLLSLAGAVFLAFGPATVKAEEIDAATQAKVDAMKVEIAKWANDPVIVNPVKKQNGGLPDELATMDQDQWKRANLFAPAVRNLTKNKVAGFLKEKKTDAVSEAFVSDANGFKVGFLAKTSGWSHKGKAKHDVPMTGKTWQGEPEVDSSTGLKQVQISVPVIDGGKPIGSLVVGLALSRLGD